MENVSLRRSKPSSERRLKAYEIVPQPNPQPNPQSYQGSIITYSVKSCATCKTAPACGTKFIKSLNSAQSDDIYAASEPNSPVSPA